MKKLSIIGMGLALVLLGAGCQKVNDLEDRVSALEDKTAKIEAAISQLQAAVDGKYAVEKVEELENGYKIVFTNGKSIELVNGKDGADGDPGKDGADGAPGADGKDGVDGAPGADGKDGDSFFKSVTVTAEFVTVVLNDEAQTTFVLPKAVKIVIGDAEAPYVKFAAGTFTVPVSIPALENVASVTANLIDGSVVTKSYASSWDYELSNDCTYVTVKAPEAVTNDCALLQVIVAKTDGTTYTGSKALKCVESFVTHGGYDYKTVRMKDGRVWMAENLHYVPEGGVIAEADDFSVKTGIYLPCVTSGDKNVAASADQAVINAQGLFYSDDIAFGGTAPEWANNTDVENNQGICPDGWHIPTLAEGIALVGKCNDKTLNDVNAPYYNATDARCNLLEINQDGINFQPYSYVNGEASYGNRVLNLSGVAEYAGMNSMDYFHLSTGRVTVTSKGTTVQNYAFMISNVAASTTIVVGYNNIANACHVRCIRDKQGYVSIH